MRDRFRFVIAGLLFAAGMINYMDRAALAIVAPRVARDLALSPHELGEIFSSFFFGYAIFCFIGGQLADRFGPRRVYAWAMVVWSLFCGLTATAVGFFSLFVTRLGFGVGEGPMCATTNKTVCNWFPREEAASMIGATFAGQPLGTAIAGPVVGLIAVAFGWRVSFVVIALFGILWLIAWLAIMRDLPQAHPRVSSAELAHIRDSRAHHTPLEVASSARLGAVLSRPSVLAVAGGLFAANYVIYFFLSWLPSYLVSVQHFSLAAMSLASSVPWLGGSAGYVLGGVISDWLLRRRANGLWARKSVAMGGLGVAALAVLATGFVTTPGMAVAVITLAILFLMAAPQACWAMTQELVPPSRVGAVGGFVHFLSNISGMIAPAITGFAVEYAGGYRASFFLTGAVGLAGVAIILLFVPSGTPATARLRPVPG